MENKLLAWLDPDQHRAEQRLEEIRRKLKSKFNSRWYLSNEDVADCVQETLTRVMQNLEKGGVAPNSVPEAYIHGVANNVLKEKLDEKKREPAIRPPNGNQGPGTNVENPADCILEEIERERYLKCLRKCMQRALTPDERDLITMFRDNDFYFTEEILELFNEKPEVLSVRIFRIKRYKLKPCVKKCIGMG